MTIQLGNTKMRALCPEPNPSSHGPTVDWWKLGFPGLRVPGRAGPQASGRRGPCLEREAPSPLTAPGPTGKQEHSNEKANTPDMYREPSLWLQRPGVSDHTPHPTPQQGSGGLCSSGCPRPLPHPDRMTVRPLSCRFGGKAWGRYRLACRCFYFYFF